MTREEMLEFFEKDCEGVILYPDMENALVGYTVSCGDTRAVYDLDLMIAEKVRQYRESPMDGDDEDDLYTMALDDLGFNTLCLYVGEQTPVIIQCVDGYISDDSPCGSSPGDSSDSPSLPGLEE